MKFYKAFTLAEPQGGIEYFTTKAKKAFTLAEMLITLAVIGVVVAMAIPSLQTNIQDKKFRTAFKKVYAEISTAMNNAIYDKGGSVYGDYNLSAYVIDDLTKYLTSIKTTPGGQAEGQCWHNDQEWYSYNGSKMSTASGNMCISLTNGTFVYVWDRLADCSYGAPSLNACAILTIDVNGFAKPNILGKDIYSVYILKDRVIPRGTEIDTLYSSTCSSGHSGWGCAAKVLYDEDY